MTSITRAQFKEAIEAGIAAAGDGLPADDLLKLLNMAENAKEFGTNFSSQPLACPMGQLGHYDEDTGRCPLWASSFATAFDAVWCDLVYAQWIDDGYPNVIQVTE